MKRLIFLSLLLLSPCCYAQTVLTLQSADCGDHRVITCTAPIAEGGTFHIHLGKTNHALTLTNAGPNKITATDDMVRGTVISGDGIDHLLIESFSAKDASGMTFTGKCTLTLTARNVNGVKNYTLTAGTVTIQ